MNAYICGPMRHVELYNFPLFNATAKELRKAGYSVFNPAEQDVERDGFNPATDQPKSPAFYMKHDLPAVCDCDVVACLPKWHGSHGCRIEVFVALALGKQICDAFTMQPLSKTFVKAMLEDYLEEL